MEKKDFTILVVDDEEDWRRTNARTLEREGYTVAAAASGGEAVACARNTKFQMAFLDITMPDMDGLQLLAELKKIDEDIKVVMLTGYATVDNAGTAHKEGIIDFLEKIADDPEEMTLGDEIREIAAQVYEETAG